MGRHGLEQPLDWAEGGTTPDGPLVRFISQLRHYIPKARKTTSTWPISENWGPSRACRSFFSTLPNRSHGHNIPPLGLSSLVGMTFGNKPGIELDANENTDDITTVGQLRGPEPMADNTNAEGGLVGDLPAIDPTDEDYFANWTTSMTITRPDPDFMVRF